VPQILETQTLISCLAEHKVVTLYPGFVYQPNRQDFATKYHGYLYMPARISSYRFGPDIDLLNQAGFFGPDAKLGILLADDGSGNSQHVVNDLWKPKLAALGINPVVFTYTQVQSNADVSRDSAQWQSAILQFKAAGVNRVLFTPDEGVGGLFFTQVADSQGFRPRYGLSTYNAPGTWSGEPAGQRPGAVAWTFSVGDLGTTPSPAQLASNPASPNRTRCDSIYKGHTGATALEAMYVVCDRFFFMQAALTGATAVTPPTLLAGADKLGSSLSLADGFTNASLAPPDRYDGGAAVRVMKWNESALQWEYAGPPVKFP
jgi:hypothetical protein